MTHKFTFTTYLYRGPREIEHEVEVTYSVDAREGGPVEILSVKGVDYTSRDEDDGLYDQACDRANEDLAEWHAEQEEYRADAIRDERMMMDFQS